MITLTWELICSLSRQRPIVCEQPPSAQQSIKPSSLLFLKRINDGIIETLARAHTRLVIEWLITDSVLSMPELIATPAQIWQVVSPVDLRRSIDGLSFIVQQTLGHSPCAGSAFIFRNRMDHRIKLLLWDGNGVWLCQRRLHQGRFVWPKTRDTHFQ